MAFLVSGTDGTHNCVLRGCFQWRESRYPGLDRKLSSSRPRAVSEKADLFKPREATP